MDITNKRSKELLKMTLDQKREFFDTAKAYLEALAYKINEEKVGYTIFYPDNGGSDRYADFEIIRLAQELGAVI
jgi:aryl-alcohol dehydrogenase-like predicted oxidoreductase